MNRHFLLGLFFLCKIGVFAQLPNQAFMDRDDISAADTGRWQLKLKTLGFTKNNEYFNQITDGYSLFGIQLHPNLTYTLSDNFRLDAGVYLRQDFGAPGFRELVPTITFRAKLEGIDILFGTIDGSLNHNLIEPLFDFENVLVDRLEQGIQFRVDKEVWDLDMWMDWETAIYRGDPKQEEVYGGINFNAQIGQPGGSVLKIPFQLLLYHRGGSIDSSPNPLQTTMNLATGLTWESAPTSYPGKWEASAYYVYHRAFASTLELTYRDGNGYYLNLMRHFKHDIKMMLSFWKANEFISLRGGKLYPTVSNNFKKPNEIDPNRTLLIFRFLQEFDLGKGVVIVSRIEPYYDFNLKKMEFSHGLYFNFRKGFDLWKN